MIQGLWNHQVESIIDVKLSDSDADSYKYEPMAALLARWETIKKDKHCKHCHDQWIRFLPFFSQWMECQGGKPWLYSHN